MPEQQLAPACGRPTASTGRPCTAGPAHFPGDAERFIWTGERVPRSGACVNHMPPEEREEYHAQRDAQRAALLAAAFARNDADPACWSWPVEPIADPDEAALAAWQAGRCAICGRTGDRLLTDHDHATALIRGLLCRSCNTREGQDQRPFGLFARYRERPPAALLGMTVRYWHPWYGEATPRPRPVEDADRWTTNPVAYE